MIVVAIIGILAAVAIPAYQDYIARSQVTEAINLTGGLKAPIAEYFQNTGSAPSLADVGATTSGKYVASLTIGTFGTNGITVEATMKNTGLNKNIQGGKFGIESPDAGSTWLCGSLATNTANDINDRYLPSSCK